MMPGTPELDRHRSSSLEPFPPSPRESPSPEPAEPEEYRFWPPGGSHDIREWTNIDVDLWTNFFLPVNGNEDLYILYTRLNVDGPMIWKMLTDIHTIEVKSKTFEFPQQKLEIILREAALARRAYQIESAESASRDPFRLMQFRHSPTHT